MKIVMKLFASSNTNSMNFRFKMKNQQSEMFKASGKAY
jgi:hypothetical protein